MHVVVLPYFNLPVDHHVVNLLVCIIKQFGLKRNTCDFIWDMPGLNLWQVTLYHDQTFTAFP